MAKQKGLYDFSRMTRKLSKELDEDRFAHTLGVAYTATALAMRYDIDLDQARAAGLLHDCAKCLSDKKKIAVCEKGGIEISAAEQRNPFLLHAKAGAYLADKDYEVKDPEVLSAIRFHTTGRAGMTPLEKIVFLADYIEPGRNKAQNLPLIRKTAFQDLDRAIYLTLRDTLNYLKNKDSDLDETTAAAFEFYASMMTKRGEAL